MKTVAVGAYELRVRGADGIYRAFYFTKSSEGILVFHAFMKKTPKTPLEEIDVGRRRLKELLED
jgi:phage-related protein